MLTSVETLLQTHETGKKLETQECHVLARIEHQQCLSSLLIRVQIYANILENSMALFIKGKEQIPCIPAIPFLGLYTRKNFMHTMIYLQIHS